MSRYIARRLLSVIPVMFLVSLIAFSLIHLVPGDPAVALAGDGATSEQVEHMRQQLGLDDALPVQYARWLKHAVTGDLGHSLFSAQTVADALWSRLPVTLSLIAGSLLIALCLGIPAGIISAVRRGSWTDRLVNLGAAAGVSTPNYFIAMLLIIFFVLRLQLLPATGYVGLFDSPTEWVRHLVLPCIALAAGTTAVVTRQLRSSLAGVLDQDYVRTSHAKGLTPGQVVLKHGMKNAAIPLVTVIGTQIGLLVGGTAIIERLFNIPGLGSLAIDSVLRRDLPMIQGIVLLTALVVQLANLAADVAYGSLNPKVRVAP
ncbi:MAG: ABC transporter permease [Ilumatobacteraceae bacterium]